jgi:hypothetical protein
MRRDREVEGPICFILRQLKESKKNYGASQLEYLCLVWALEKIYYYLDGCAFHEVITDCIALKLLINMKNPSHHMMRLQISIQEWRGSMIIVHREGAIHINADRLLQWALPNDSTNPAADLEEVQQEVPIMAILVCGLMLEFWEGVAKSYLQHHDTACLINILRSKEARSNLEEALTDPWKTSY